MPGPPELRPLNPHSPLQPRPASVAAVKPLTPIRFSEGLAASRALRRRRAGVLEAAPTLSDLRLPKVQGKALSKQGRVLLGGPPAASSLPGAGLRVCLTPSFQRLGDTGSPMAQKKLELWQATCPGHREWRGRGQRRSIPAKPKQDREALAGRKRQTSREGTREGGGGSASRPSAAQGPGRGPGPQPLAARHSSSRKRRDRGGGV